MNLAPGYVSNKQLTDINSFQLAIAPFYYVHTNTCKCPYSNTCTTLFVLIFVGLNFRDFTFSRFQKNREIKDPRKKVIAKISKI